MLRHGVSRHQAATAGHRPTRVRSGRPPRKAVRDKLRAAIPNPIATAASISVHPAVIHPRQTLLGLKGDDVLGVSFLNNISHHHPIGLASILRMVNRYGESGAVVQRHYLPYPPQCLPIANS
jgi:hypothetical protein